MNLGLTQQQLRRVHACYDNARKQQLYDLGGWARFLLAVQSALGDEVALMSSWLAPLCVCCVTLLLCVLPACTCSGCDMLCCAVLCYLAAAAAAQTAT